MIWAQGMGQLPASGTIPMTGVLAAPPNRFAVKFDIDGAGSRAVPRGGRGRAARRSTRSGLRAIHIIRKVILRVGAYTDYLILKLH